MPQAITSQQSCRWARTRSCSTALASHCLMSWCSPKRQNGCFSRSRQRDKRGGQCPKALCQGVCVAWVYRYEAAAGCGHQVTAPAAPSQAELQQLPDAVPGHEAGDLLHASSLQQLSSGGPLTQQVAQQPLEVPTRFLIPRPSVFITSHLVCHSLHLQAPPSEGLVLQ
jgi:hypothetical protein